MSLLEHPDRFFMQEAIKEARLAYESDEVPVGAIITCRGRLIARAHNQTQQLNDPTAHAEILAITAATEYLGGKYLDRCTLYVTLEPCVMCAGALYWARIGRIAAGAIDEKRGFMKVCGHSVLHPKTDYSVGLEREICSALLVDYFNSKRN